MKTYEIIRQIRSYESMCEAGKAATVHFLRACLSDPTCIPAIGNFRVRDIRACHGDLEHTYLIQMFAVFETTLRQLWERVSRKTSHPSARQLMDRLVLRCNMPIDHVAKAHAVREFRNTLVHGGRRESLTIGDARSCLCKFLSGLPREW